MSKLRFINTTYKCAYARFMFNEADISNVSNVLQDAQVTFCKRACANVHSYSGARNWYRVRLRASARHIKLMFDVLL